MATHSTVPTVKARLVTVFAAALLTEGEGGTAIQVSYSWPGPRTENPAVFLGYHPELKDISLDFAHEVPTIKAGRKQREETYAVPVTIWSFHPELDPTGAATAEARGFEIFGLLEDVLADDPTLGLTGTPPPIKAATVADSKSIIWPFKQGWAVSLEFNVAVQARLL